MDPDSLNQRLSRITTLWTLVRQAHAGPPVAAAQEQIVARYAGAVHRYLLGALRDSDAADELFQEFALRFLRGDFQRADPERGRFRDFVKTIVFHLIVDYQRRRRLQPLAPGHEPAAEPPSVTDAERAFRDSWRTELMERTWLALAELERATGQPHHTLLRLRAEQPLLSSAELADHLGTRLGKAFTTAAARQALHRAREKFTDLLLGEVTQSLENPTGERLEEELADLGLLSYCQAALERRGLRRSGRVE